MSKKIRLVAIVKREYWADPEHYDGCKNAQDMANLDASGYFLDLIDHEDSVFTVEVIGEEK